MNPFNAKINWTQLPISENGKITEHFENMHVNLEWVLKIKIKGTN